MKNLTIKLIFSFCIMFTFFACKDDDSVNPPSEQEGGDVYRYEVAIIYPEQTITEDVYEASLNGMELQVLKANDSTAVFVVPANVALGINELSIPGLNNFKVSYNVLDVELTGTPQEVINGYIYSLELAEQELSETPEVGLLSQSIDSLREIFDNATSEQKKEMALSYLANKEMIDNITNGNISSDRYEIAHLLLFDKYSDYAWYAGTTAVATLAAIPYGWHTPVLATASITCAIRAKNIFIRIAEITYESIFLDIEGIQQKTGNNQNIFGTVASDDIDEAIVFEHDVQRSLSFKIVRKTIEQADEGDSNAYYLSFFNSLGVTNGAVGKINSVISWINEHIPFANFPVIPTNSAAEEANVSYDTETPDIMNNLSFNVSHPNLQLVTTTVNSSGNLLVKIKIVGTPETDVITSALNYSYHDDFSNISGSFPIEVLAEPFSIEGNWILTELYEEAANEWHIYEYECPGQREDYFFTGEATFTANSFTININEQFNYFNYGEGCVILENELHEGFTNYQGQYDNESYEQNGTSFVVTQISGNNDGDYNWNPNNGYFEVINNNQIILWAEESDEFESWTLKIILERQ